MSGAVTAVAAFDERVDRAVEPLRTRPGLTRLMYALSELGDFSLIWHIISVGRAAVGGSRREREMVRLSAALVVEGAVVNGLIKSMFRRPRPEVATERPHALRTPRTSSFPSGHASAAACAVVILADGSGPVETAVYAGIGALVAVSRVHVRIHHASDVVGGVVVGAALGSLARRIRPLA